MYFYNLQCNEAEPDVRDVLVGHVAEVQDKGEAGVWLILDLCGMKRTGSQKTFLSLQILALSMVLLLLIQNYQLTLWSYSFLMNCTRTLLFRPTCMQISVFKLLVCHMLELMHGNRHSFRTTWDYFFLTGIIRKPEREMYWSTDEP